MEKASKSFNQSSSGDDVYEYMYICVGRNCQIAGKFALAKNIIVVKRINDREKGVQNWKKFQDKK